MPTKWENQNTDELIEVILSLDGKDEAKSFLRDLLTESELMECGNRWKVARMLNEGIPYTKIEKKTSMSSTTIARISKWLNSGMGGYKTILEKLEAHHNTIHRS